MVALGPRVGGAHVDVNLSFDPKSIGRVGQKIQQQLARIGERNRKAYQAIGKNAVTAWRSALGVIVSSAPLIGSAVSGLAGAFTLLAGAMYSTTQSSFGLAPLLAAIGVAAGTAAIGMHGFMDAVRAGDPEELEAALADLSPSARASALAVRSLGDAWHRLRMTVQERMFAGLSGEIRQLSTTLIPVLETGLGKMADSLNGLARSLLQYTNSSAGLKQIGDLLDNSADIFDRLAKAAVPFLDGTLRLLNALAPAGKRLADRIAEVAQKFQDWTKAEGFGKRIDDMMQRAEKTAGLLFKTLGNLGSAISNVFGASNPATNQFLEMLVEVTQRFEDWTSSVEGQNSIAEWASNSVDVMRQFGRTLESVFEVLAELSDSGVIISFLKTLEDAFDYLAKLPLDKMVEGFVQLAEQLQPVSSLFLAFIIAGASFNIIVGSIAGQLGGLVSVLGKVTTPLVALFKPLESAGKHGKELSGLSAAMGRISGVLGRIATTAIRFSKFIPFVGWAVAIGTIIAKSEEVREKIGGLFDAVKGVGDSIGKAFSDIAESLAPLAPVADKVGGSMDWLFDIFNKFGAIILGNGIASLTHVFQGLGRVIEGVGKYVSGFIDVVVGLFTLDGDKIVGGFKKMGDGILDVFLGLGEAILAPIIAAFETISELAGGTVASVKAAFSAVPGLIMSAFHSAVNGVVSVVTGLWNRVKSIFTSAMNGLRSLIAASFLFYVGIITSVFGTVVSFIRNTWNSIITVITTAVTVVRTRISTGFNALVGVVKGAFNRVRNAVTSALSAIRGAVSSGMATVNRLFKAAVNGIKDAWGDIWGGLKGVATKAWGNVATWLRKLPRKVTNALAGLGSALKAPFTSAFGAVAKLWNNTVGRIKFEVPGWVPAFGGKGWGFPTIPGYEMGTLFAPGGLALVGEKGPELVDLPRGSKVKTATQTQRALNNSRTETRHIQVVNNYFGPTTGGGKMRELDWNLRFATKSRAREGLVGA